MLSYIGLGLCLTGFIIFQVMLLVFIYKRFQSNYTEDSVIAHLLIVAHCFFYGMILVQLGE